MRSHRSNPRLLALALAALAGLAGCASAGHPAVVTAPPAAVTPAPGIDAIRDYETAVATVAGIFVNDFGFPVFPVAFHFYPDRRAFEAALLDTGYDPALARETAATMGAIGGHRRVLLNAAILVPLSWPARVELLAHEMAHSLQYEWGGGTRGRSDQWLREGFAEWIAVSVLERLGAVSLHEVRRRRVREVRAGGPPPPLDALATFPQWVAESSRSGSAPYARAFLAVDALIARHGVAGVGRYFQLFVLSQDRRTNFRIAFDDDLPAFEQTLQTGLR